MVEHRTQFAFKGKREHIHKVNIPNIAHPNQHIDIEIPHGSRDHVIIPDTIKITFNLDIESTDKARSVVINVGRVLIKKKVLMLGSKDIDMIDDLDIYDKYKDLFLSKEEREGKLLQGIQPANGLKARVGAKKSDGTALILTTQENAIKKTFDKRFSIKSSSAAVLAASSDRLGSHGSLQACTDPCGPNRSDEAASTAADDDLKRFSIPLDFDFIKHPVYPYGLKENLLVRLELNSSWKVILCTGDTSATYKLSDILLEYDAIFDEPYATTIGEMYNGTTSIPHTNVGLIHYQTLSKIDTI